MHEAADGVLRARRKLGSATATTMVMHTTASEITDLLDMGVMPNVKVSDGSQPPSALNLYRSATAGSHSLDRLVGAGSCPNPLSRLLLVRPVWLPAPTRETIFCAGASQSFPFYCDVQLV